MAVSKVARIVKVYMYLRGYRQRDLGAAVGCSGCTFSNWFAGHSVPDPVLLHTVVDHLKIPSSELLQALKEDFYYSEGELWTLAYSACCDQEDEHAPE